MKKFRIKFRSNLMKPNKFRTCLVTTINETRALNFFWRTQLNDWGRRLDEIDIKILSVQELV